MNNTYFGFTNNLKPMQAAKMEKSLDKLIRFDLNDKELVKTSKEFVYLKLQNGAKPEFQENYTYYSPKLEDYTKPKTLYTLEHPDGRTYNEINKTLYNYALHLIENDFLNEEKAKTFIEQEKIKAEEAERLEQERIEKERVEKQKAKEEEDRKNKEELIKKQNQWLEVGEQLLQSLKNNPIAEVLDKHFNELMEIFPSGNKEENYNSLNNRYTIMLGNPGLCTHRLQYYVECENEDTNKFTLKGNPTMFLEKEILFKTFEVQISDKPATITAKVKALFENREYKGSKPIVLETFYYLKGTDFVECEAPVIKIKGIEFFLRTENEYHILYEARSGRSTLKNTSKTELMKKVREIIKDKRDRLESSIETAIKQTGLSPRYKAEAPKKHIENNKVDLSFVPVIAFNEEGQGVLF